MTGCRLAQAQRSTRDWRRRVSAAAVGPPARAARRRPPRGPAGPCSRRSSCRCCQAWPTSGPGRDAEDRHDLRCRRGRAGSRRAPPARAAARSAPRGRRRRARSAAALRRLRVVQSERVSLCSRSSSGPASRDVAAHRRVGPLAVAVAVEAQVQLDQPRDVLDDVLGEAQRLQPRAWSASRRPPRGGGRRPRRPARTGASSACRCRAAARPAAARGPGPSGPPARSPARARSACARRRPCAGGARRSPAAARGSSGSTWSARPVSTSSASPARGCGASSSLFSSSRTRSAETIVDPVGHRRHRRDHLRVDREAQLRGEPGGAQHPQRVVGERVLRAARACAAPARRGRRSPPYGSTNVAARQRDRHRVDREVAADAGRPRASRRRSPRACATSRS